MAEQLFPASLGGVPFHVTDSTEQGGPYNVLHEFAGRAPSSAYNGPRPKKFTLECYLIGDRYQVEWERLKEVLNRGGAHRLVHPWLGSYLVALDGPYEAKHSSGHLGMVKVSLPLHEAGPDLSPSIRVETDELLIAEADSLDDAIAGMVENDFTTEGSNALADSSTTIVEDIVNAVRDMNAASSAQFAAIGTTSTGIRRFGASVTTLINTPRTLATTVAGLIDATFQAITNVADATGEIDPLANVDTVLSAVLRGRQVLVALRLLRDGNSFGSDYPTRPENTPLQAQRALNQRRLVQLVRLSSVAAAARAAARLQFENTAQVSAAFDQITNAIDNARGSVDDAVYRALSRLRAALSAHLRQNMGRLPEVTSYTPVASVPSLLIAHTLYGDARRHQEIEERNGIVNPCFVPGGVSIEVLSA